MDEPRQIHTRLIFGLSGREELRFVDIRKFGGVYYLAYGGGIPRGLAELGPEPLERGFTTGVLADLLQGRRGPLKGVLLDQRSLAGIGNIYADEVLHRAGLSPLRPAGSLDGTETERLHSAIRTVLTEGIDHRGTSVRNYVDGDGRPGEFQDRLRVYGQAGRACASCGGIIIRVVVSGRGTQYCPACQK